MPRKLDLDAKIADLEAAIAKKKESLQKLQDMRQEYYNRKQEAECKELMDFIMRKSIPPAQAIEILKEKFSD